jgi:recombination protein RecA
MSAKNNKPMDDSDETQDELQEETEVEDNDPVSTEDVINSAKSAANSAGEVDGLPDVCGWCSTGCLQLDLAISDRMDGGIPLGRVVHAFGGGSTAKTVLGTTILGYAQRAKMHAYMNDVEHTLDQRFASMYGLDCTDKLFHLDHSDTLEDMFDNYIGGIIFPYKDKKKMNTSPKVLVIDSVTALPTMVELSEKMEAGTYGMTRPKQMSKGFRKYTFPMANSNTTLFCIDQTRDNVGVLFGKKETTSGGRALEFYSSVQIYLQHESNIVNSKKVTIGIWVKFEIVKNKVAAPFRKGRFKILFDYGLDDISSNIRFLAIDQCGEKAAKNRGTMLKALGKEMPIQNWTKYIEDNGLEAELRQAVYELWRVMHRVEERKPRVW